MIQITLFLFSSLSIYLLSSKTNFRYGFVVGLCGQPFWIYASLQAEQWGIFAVSLWFAFSYIRGIKNNFQWIPRGGGEIEGSN
jgi:hypothetical protein